MSFRAPLLKPSERNGHLKKSRGISKQSRYEVLKEKIRGWWHDRLKIGEALREIRDEKLYKHEHSNFEDFCVQEFDLKHSQAYALIAAVEVKDSLKPSAIAERITNEGQARALAAVPDEKRVEVLEDVILQGPVTAKAITAAAAKIAPPKLAEVPLDKTGYPIPESISEDWKRAVAQKSLLIQISEVRSVVKTALENKDLIFAEVNNTTVADLNNAYGSLKNLIPYAVCASCQGKQKTKCALCRGRGFISEFAYLHFVPKETRDLREKMRAK